MPAVNPFELKQPDIDRINTWSAANSYDPTQVMAKTREKIASGEIRSSTDLDYFAKRGNELFGTAASPSATGTTSGTTAGTTGQPIVTTGNTGAATNTAGGLIGDVRSSGSAQTGPYQITPTDEARIRAYSTLYGYNPDQAMTLFKQKAAAGEIKTNADLDYFANKYRPGQTTGAQGGAGTDTPKGYDVTSYAAEQTKPSALQTSGVIKAGVTDYTPNATTSEGYTAETRDAGGYTAGTRGSDTYTADAGKLNTWTVDPNQLVENRVAGLIAGESPMMQLAATKAKQNMAGRGLLNSSMAEGEAQKAVIETATPIASQDASTLARAGEVNATQANLMEQFNVGQSNISKQFNAQESNKAKSDNQAALNRASEFLAQAENAAKSDNVNAKNNAAAFTTQAANLAKELTVKAQNDAAAFKAQAANAATAAEAQASNLAAAEATRVANESQAAYTAAVNRQKEQEASASTEMAKFDAQAKNDLTRDDSRAKADMALQDAKIRADAALQQLDATTRTEIQTLANDAQKRASTSQSANSLYVATMGAIDTIMNNGDLDVDAKQKAVSTQRDNLKTGLDFLSATSGISGLKDLITFPTT